MAVPLKEKGLEIDQKRQRRRRILSRKRIYAKGTPLSIGAGLFKKGEREMFDMQKIGRKIAELRKQKSMTQMELADRMNISYQAVSNWERGNTMPDISKLPELAEIFGVSMEEILCDERRAKIVEELAEGKTPGDVTTEELKDIAPIATQEQFKKTYTENGKRNKWNFSDLAALAPFLDEDDLMEFASAAFEESGSLKEIAAIAPFLKEEDVARLAFIAAERGGNPAEIAVVAPFMEEADVGKLALALCGKGNLKDLAVIAPFMNEKDVAAAAEELRKEGSALEELAALAPFMDPDALNKMAAEHLAGGGDIKDLITVAPFLNGSALKEMFKNFRK
jgi:hypothetical protein